MNNKPPTNTTISQPTLPMTLHQRLETIENDSDYAAARAIATGLLTDGDGEAGRELIRLAALMEAYEFRRQLRFT